MLSEKTWMIITYMIIVFFVVSDRLLKFFAVNNYFENQKVIIEDLLKLNFVKNYNIAFSIPIGGWVLNIIIIFIIIWLVYYLTFLILRDKFTQSIFILSIIFGAASNLFDRFKYGYVVDYFDLEYFTVFNLADVMIVLGVFGMGWVVLKENKKTA